MKKRVPGKGTLRLRKDGRWEGRIVVGYDEKGLPETKNVTSKSKEKCIKKLEKLRNELLPANEKIDPDITFGEWMKIWYETYSKPKLGINTRLQSEQLIYKHIIPSLGSIELKRLKQSDLQKFYTELKNNGRLHNREKCGKGLSDRTVRTCHSICRAALIKAVNENIISKNPSENCKLPPKAAKEMQVLTNEEMQRFLIQAKEEGCFEFVLLELATGLRRGEIGALRWEDLNPKNGELHISRQIIHVTGGVITVFPKTKSSDRIIILPPSVLEVLKNLKERTDSEWMFPSPVKENSPLDTKSIDRKIKKILGHAECKNIRFHDLRHTFATAALENGMDIKTLSSIIGHVSAKTAIDIYSHITDTMQVNAAEKIENGIGTGEAYSAQEGVFETSSGDSTCTPQKAEFRPYKGKIRKSGTGGVYMINDHLFEGKYTPTNAHGKRESHNVYAKTREECEEKLDAMIKEVKEKIRTDKERLAET